MNETLTRTVGYYTNVDSSKLGTIITKINRGNGRVFVSVDEAKEKSYIENLNKLNKLADHFKECEKP